MEIIAKKGTEFEKTLKAMCDKKFENVNGAKSLVKEMAGVEPEGIFHIFGWGTISRLIPEFEININDIGKIDPHILRKKKGTNSVYVPAQRYKKGQELYSAFNAYAKKCEITEEPLNEFGIHMIERCVSYYINPIYDTETDRYMLICSDSIHNGFNKKKLARDQFDIEYE